VCSLSHTLSSKVSNIPWVIMLHSFLDIFASCCCFQILFNLLFFCSFSLFFSLIFSLFLTLFFGISLLISSGISLYIPFSSLERQSFYRFKQNQEVIKPFTIFMVVFPNVGCYGRFPTSLSLKVVVSGFPLFSIKWTLSWESNLKVGCFMDDFIFQSRLTG